MEEVDCVLSLVHRGLQSTRRRSVGLGSPRDVRNVTLSLTSSEASLIAAALCCYKEVKSDQLFHSQLDHDSQLSTDTDVNKHVKSYLKRTFSRAPRELAREAAAAWGGARADGGDALPALAEGSAEEDGDSESAQGELKRAKTEMGRLRTDSDYRVDEIALMAIGSVPTSAVRTTLVRAVDTLHRWDFDAFNVAAVCEHPLAFVGLEVIASRDLGPGIEMDWNTLGRFLIKVDETYCDVPYHNSTHATDVTATMHYFLTTGGLEQHLSPVQTFSVLVGVMIHDVGHIGLNTAFLKSSNHPLAIRYNDHSPLENMHLATAFGLMLDESLKCDIFEALDPALRSAIRFNMIDLVLATDMADHNRVRRVLLHTCAFEPD